VAGSRTAPERKPETPRLHAVRTAVDVRCEKVVTVLNDFRAVDGVDLDIHEGEIFSHNFRRGGTIVRPHRDERAMRPHKPGVGELNDV
jgi:hypothetical protein